MPRHLLFRNAPAYTISVIALNLGVGLAAILQAPHRTHADVGAPVHAWGILFLLVGIATALSVGHPCPRRVAAGIGLSVWVAWSIIYTGSAITDGGNYMSALLWWSGTIRHFQVVRDRRASRR